MQWGACESAPVHACFIANPVDVHHRRADSSHKRAGVHPEVLCSHRKLDDRPQPEPLPRQGWVLTWSSSFPRARSTRGRAAGARSSERAETPRHATN